MLILDEGYHARIYVVRVDERLRHHCEFCTPLHRTEMLIQALDSEIRIILERQKAPIRTLDVYWMRAKVKKRTP